MDFRAKKGLTLHTYFHLVTIDPAARPALPGSARLCPVHRSHDPPSEPYSSRASAQDDARWQRQTPSNYYDYYYYYYYYYYQ